MAPGAAELTQADQAPEAMPGSHGHRPDAGGRSGWALPPWHDAASREPGRLGLSLSEKRALCDAYMRLCRAREEVDCHSRSGDGHLHQHIRECAVGPGVQPDGESTESLP